jgi:hypothetical protein
MRFVYVVEFDTEKFYEDNEPTARAYIAENIKKIDGVLSVETIVGGQQA